MNKVAEEARVLALFRDQGGGVTYESKMIQR